MIFSPFTSYTRYFVSLIFELVGYQNVVAVDNGPTHTYLIGCNAGNREKLKKDEGLRGDVGIESRSKRGGRDDGENDDNESEGEAEEAGA